MHTGHGDNVTLALWIVPIAYGTDVRELLLFHRQCCHLHHLLTIKPVRRETGHHLAREMTPSTRVSEPWSWQPRNTTCSAPLGSQQIAGISNWRTFTFSCR